jgi:hypothetical protein
MCFGWPTAKQAWEGSPLVFAGVVEDVRVLISEEPFAVQQVKVRVVEPFKGAATDQIVELRQPINGCSPNFQQSNRELFYLHPSREAGYWNAPGCHRNRSLGDAADDLVFLRALPGSARGNRLSGSVELL